MNIALNINGQRKSVDADPTTPLLWVLRDHLGMTGTKFGCGIAQCGACTVHIDGAAVRSCVMPLAAVSNKRITTIEGLSKDSSHPLQKAWVEDNVAQCGYCQSGMLMAAAALLRSNPRPTDADIDAKVNNICRCGTYPRVRAAIHKVARMTVEVSKKGVVRVDSVDLAIDPGRVGYPDGVASQLEGGAIFALNSALNEQVTVENGRIVEGNYHQYPMLRIGDVPKRINVHFGAVSGHSRMAFVGESAMGPVPPALGNAIFAATGKRLRSMPFRVHDLSWT